MGMLSTVSDDTPSEKGGGAMDAEAQYLADRTLLRTLLRTQPTWSQQDLADATQHSLSWVKKWVKRIRTLPENDHVLHAQSRARKHPPPALSAVVIDRLLELPEPLSAWQLDFKDVATVRPEGEGKQQHVVEVLNTVDVGTSILVNAQVREDFTAETTLQAVVDTFRTQGLPESIILDRDPRFVGSPQGRDFPAPLVRLLHGLGVQVTVCPPRRPAKNAFVERYNRTYAHECLAVYGPTEIETVRTVTDGFRQHDNFERPNQALSCGNQPPCVAYPTLPPRPALPALVDPDRLWKVLDGHRYVRKVRSNGTVTVDGLRYYVEQAWEGKYVSLRIDAPERVFVVEYRDQVIKVLPVKALLGERLPIEVYVEQMAVAARTQLVGGRPIGQQLRLPL